MFENLKNIDTIKSQILVGIIAGVIIMLITFISGIYARTVGHMGNINTYLPLVWNIARWILMGCAVALMILGGWNIYKGMIGYGIAGLVGGLLLLVGAVYTVHIFWRFDDSAYVHGALARDFCLTTASPF